MQSFRCFIHHPLLFILTAISVQPGRLLVSPCTVREKLVACQMSRIPIPTAGWLVPCMEAPPFAFHAVARNAGCISLEPIYTPCQVKMTRNMTSHPNAASNIWQNVAQHTNGKTNEQSGTNFDHAVFLPVSCCLVFFFSSIHGGAISTFGGGRVLPNAQGPQEITS